MEKCTSTTKWCNCCNRNLPHESFSKNKSLKYGLCVYCKECSKQRYQDNKEKISARQKRYYAENRERLNDRSREYYYNNQEWYGEYHKKWREEHKEHAKEYRRTYHINNREKENVRNRLYTQENHKKTLQAQREYYQNNREEILAKNRERDKNNRERSRARWHRYNSKKKRLLATLTPQQWEAILLHFDNKCAYCGNDGKLQQEHFIPVNKGGEYTHNNIIPACKSCNVSKSDKDFRVWYPRYRHYSKKRERKIIEFLGYGSNGQQLKLMALI